MRAPDAGAPGVTYWHYSFEVPGGGVYLWE